jgi:hypothetical protein
MFYKMIFKNEFDLFWTTLLLQQQKLTNCPFSQIRYSNFKYLARLIGVKAQAGHG